MAKEMISIFPLWTFHLYVATIPAAPAYGQTDRQHNGQIKKGQKDKQYSTKTISQLIWYSRACDSYQDLLDKSVAAYKEATETRVPIG